MYPKNAASPEPIAIGPVVQISDGAVQTAGCTVRIKPIGVAEGDGAGTTAYSTDGIVLYTPTQAETNYTSFILIAKKASCIPASVTVVTTSSATPGTVLLAPVTHTSAVVPTVTTLTGHTAQTGDSYAIVNSGTHGNASLKTLIDAVDNILDTEFPALITTIGTPAGVSIAADLLTIDNLVDGLESTLTLAAIADAVWDEAIAGHAAAGSTGEALSAAGSAGDPWTTALPGAYGAGTAGKIIGDNINATVGSRSSHTAANVRTEMDSNSTQLAAIVADTNELQTDWANGGRLDLILDARASQASVDTVAAYLDTEVASILAAVDTEIATIVTAVGTSIPATLSGLFTTALTESYRGAGAAGSVSQYLHELIAHHGEKSIASTTMTLKKLDGSTTAKTYTLNDASTPTSVTETT